MEKEIDVALISPLSLAYLGDSVLEIYVRERVVTRGSCRIDVLHKQSVVYVNAYTQSQFYNRIEDQLTKEESDILKRGRNQKKKIPRNADMNAYRKSTGVEALFGYLYLMKREERLKELLSDFFRMVEGSCYI